MVALGVSTPSRFETLHRAFCKYSFRYESAIFSTITRKNLIFINYSLNYIYQLGEDTFPYGEVCWLAEIMSLNIFPFNHFFLKT